MPSEIIQEAFSRNTESEYKSIIPVPRKPRQEMTRLRPGWFHSKSETEVNGWITFLWLKTTRDSSGRGSDVFFGPPGAPGTHVVHILTFRQSDHIHIFFLIYKEKKKNKGRERKERQREK